MTNSYAKIRVRKIIRRFGMIPLSSQSLPSFYRRQAVIQVQTESGTYALKPYLRKRSLRTSAVRQITKTADYIQLLMNSGFSYMPNWLTSNSGRLWTLHRGKPFYVTAWITGRGLENQEDFEELGRALAALHTTSGQFLQKKGPFTPKQIRLWQRQDRLFRERMAKAIRLKARDRGWYKKFGDFCNRFSDRVWTELRSPELAALMEKETSRPALIHNDITSPNVIISEDGRLFIIDWDSMKAGSVYVDLAKALMNTTQFNPGFIDSLLRGYEELYPFDRAERKLISCLYGLPREAWHATQFPHHPRSREMLNIMEQTWQLRLQAMDYLEEWANRGEGI